MKAIMALVFCVSLAFSQAVTRSTTKTTTWDGTLVDAVCQTTQTQRTTQGAGKSERTVTTEVVRCPVTPQSTSFGILTADGQFIRFDNASNTRTIEVMKLKTMAGETQPLRVHVVGMANGDTAVVESINLQGHAEQAHAATTSAPAEIALNVKWDGDKGKLMVGDKGISFENVSDARRSKTWTYAQIQEFKRESNNRVTIEPFDDHEYEFTLDGPAMADATYKMISDRIVAARAK